MRQANGTGHPRSKEIRARREKAGLTQTGAAELVHVTLRTWQNYEAAETPMHPGLWELFKIKTRKVRP